MKLQEAPNAICKVVKFPASVTSYLRTEDCQNEQCNALKGGLLKGKTYYAYQFSLLLLHDTLPLDVCVN